MEKPKNKKRTILVTGGLGFIGSNYLNKFVLNYPHYRFVNVDAEPYAADPKNILVAKQPNYFFEKADIRKLPAIEKIFEKYRPDGVVHFAAESHVDISIEKPALFIETNVIGTHNLLMASKKYSVERYYQISTDEVYGSLNAGDKAFRTASPLAPNSPYSASKTSGDLLVRAYHETFGLNTVISRCSNNYGPNQDKTKLIPKFISLLLAGKKVPLYAKGANIRDWVYVEDHIDAIDLIFHKGKPGHIYNVGGNCEMSNIQIVKRLLKLTRKDMSSVEHVADRLGHDFRYAIDTREINKELGWKPKYDFEKGIAKTFEYYKTKI